MILKRHILILILLTLSSCIFEQGFKHNVTPFTVEKGDHKFKEDKVGIRITKPSFKTKGSSRIFVSFDESTFYDKGLLGKDSMDINKLYGLSDCYANHLKNSARFGWRPIDSGLMEIFAYVYADGHRIIESMGTVTPYEQAYYQLDVKGDYYDFLFKGHQVSIKRVKNCNHGVYYRLFPYFGGNMGAPNQMRIWLYEEN